MQGWVVGAIAIAHLKVRETGIVTTSEAETIAKWMQSVGEQTKNYYDTHKRAGHGDSQNNHLYWAGVELAAIGVVADDRKDFDWAMATYDNGVDQIQRDGALPLEMARGSRALHYHLYALAPLVLLAEFGEANHLDLYAHANGAIHRLVELFDRGTPGSCTLHQSYGRATRGVEDSHRRPDWVGASLRTAFSKSCARTIDSRRSQFECVFI